MSCIGHGGIRHGAWEFSVQIGADIMQRHSGMKHCGISLGYTCERVDLWILHADLC